ncbi:uncharacterized protein LOC136091917 [Hydra vulgaris]|uniref:Uncharacterized protein LOC136091917 n=1 Tax=Hydra vulgaris TaxID=6087 RepID=A0ABM4DMD3_HYDVU
MSGNQSGVQKRILEKNSKAFFVPCYAHSLNLVVNDAANHLERMWLILEWISGLKLCDLFNTVGIFDSLFEISQGISYDPSSRHEAELYRSDEASEKVISDAELIAAELDLKPSFSFEVSIRPRFKKQMLPYETRYNRIINPKDRFKIECFNCILDSAINSIEERFNQLNEHSDAFQFLTDTSADIDSMELLDELLALSELIEPKTSPLKVLEFILRNNNFTPNVSIALQILLTQPVSVASGEHSFSKLKLIKDYLRSTMSQNRLTGFSLISIKVWLKN